MITFGTLKYLVLKIYPRLCVFAFEYFVFLGRVTNPSAKPPFLEDGEPDFDKKLNRFQGICGTIRKHLKKTRTGTQMKFYKVVARPSLLYGSET